MFIGFDFSLPIAVSKLIVNKIIKLAENPSTINNNVKALKGVAGWYRLRVGDYRVVYNLNHSVQIIKIIKVGHRKEVYQWS